MSLLFLIPVFASFLLSPMTLLLWKIFSEFIVAEELSWWVQSVQLTIVIENNSRIRGHKMLKSSIV